MSDTSYRDINKYREFVAAVASAVDKNFAEKVLVTRHNEIVSVIIAKMLDQSERRLCILTRYLKPSVYGAPEVVHAALIFLSNHPEGEICVLSEAEVDPNHPLREAVVKAGFGDRFHLDVVPSHIREQYRYRFAVADGLHYRFLSDRQAKEGYVKFGDSEGGKLLEQAFDGLRDRIQRQAEWAPVSEAAR